MNPPGIVSDNPGPTGVLIVRVWYEGTAANRELRIRLVGRPDITSDAEESTWRATVPDSVDYVRGWLERFVATWSDPARTEDP